MDKNKVQSSPPKFDRIREVADGLKATLKNDFGRVYVESIEIDETKSVNEEELTSTLLERFTIEKSGDPIYKRVNSEEDLQELKKEIMEFYSKSVVDDYWGFFDNAENQLDQDTAKSLEIIGKTLQNRQKKLDASLRKFQIDDSWGIDKIQKEFASVLQAVARDIVESTLPSIENGFRASGLNVYEDTHRFVDQFLKFLGIYTKLYEAGYKIEDEEIHNFEIAVAENEEIKDKSFQNNIRSVESLAYLFEEDLPVMEAKITVWRVS